MKWISHLLLGGVLMFASSGCCCGLFHGCGRGCGYRGGAGYAPAGCDACGGGCPNGACGMDAGPTPAPLYNQTGFLMNGGNTVAEGHPIGHNHQVAMQALPTYE